MFSDCFRKSFSVREVINPVKLHIFDMLHGSRGAKVHGVSP